MNNYFQSFTVFESKKGFIDDVIFPNVSMLSSSYQQMRDSVNAMLFLSKDTIKNNLNGKKDNNQILIQRNTMRFHTSKM